MAINQALIGELEHEAATSRKILERIPESAWGWKPHDKSMDMKQLATHVTEMWGWTKAAIDHPELDFAATPYEQYDAKSTQDLLDFHDKTVAEAKEALGRATDDVMMQPWSLRKGEDIYFTMPKVQVLRAMVFNHIIHHRGQLSVYLRENDIPVPSIYGPSADEQIF
jgi:uncharacterized damage-inducible protein DinB